MNKLFENNTSKITRRDFLKQCIRLSAAAVMTCTAFQLTSRPSASSGNHTWQIDPKKCIQCEKCSTECVLTPSAVKCVHLYEKCGYCYLCSGYLIKGATNLDTAAENQLCPTGAIKRTFIEEPYFEYKIDETLCVACGRCVNNCRAFGNASLILQIRHDLCQNCNQCRIALSCPAEAFTRVPAKTPWLYDKKANSKTT
ncbi:MAG: twin-arginine translocation signal domain-containing protein [Candidatus Riflebacteria bacterium]|nr:twin-arginine translocation signal domain-containing protein [Candidatus Riflebacteria bacterium]